MNPKLSYTKEAERSHHVYVYVCMCVDACEWMCVDDKQVRGQVSRSLSAKFPNETRKGPRCTTLGFNVMSMLRNVDMTITVISVVHVSKIRMATSSCRPRT